MQQTIKMGKEDTYWELLMQGYLDSKLEYEKALLTDWAHGIYNTKETEMRILKVKEAVIINSKFEEGAVTEWLELYQPEVRWRREAMATERGFEVEFPYYLLRSEYGCLGFDLIDSDITEGGYTVINLDLLGKEVPEVESPSEAIYRLTQDKVVIETSHNFGNSFCGRESMKLVLNGNIVTDEYYQELREAINKLQCSIQFTVTIKY